MGATFTALSNFDLITDAISMRITLDYLYYVASSTNPEHKALEKELTTIFYVQIVSICLALLPRIAACVYIPLRTLYLQYIAGPDSAGLKRIQENIE